MARYADFFRRRVEVLYRAGDVFLPATGTLVADSGKSIFLEESFCQHDTVKTFRWEIPYQYIIRLCAAPEPAEVREPPSLTPSDAKDKGRLPVPHLNHRPEES
jgi:hypothetical protein